jgi:hypothetical protein
VPLSGLVLPETIAYVQSGAAPDIAAKEANEPFFIYHGEADTTIPLSVALYTYN